jgi:hypothetical protein
MKLAAKVKLVTTPEHWLNSERRSTQRKGVRFQMKYTDGLTLFEDLTERRVTFAEFLIRFSELPREEQDRLLATDPKPMAKEASA